MTVTTNFVIVVRKALEKIEETLQDKTDKIKCLRDLLKSVYGYY
jgi:hypothetical protein